MPVIVLDNWFLINKDEGISLENVGLINNFLGGVDEDWFVTIHVCIEDAASGAIDACQKISQCDENSSEKEILKLLNANSRVNAKSKFYFCKNA